MLIISFSLCSISHAQKDMFRLTGKVHDVFTDAGIAKAKVYLLNQDSVVQDSATTLGGLSSGVFSINVKRDKSLSSCIVKVCHPDYEPNYTTHSLSAVGKNSVFGISTIYIKKRSTFTEQNLGEVTVTATKVKMYYRGDTLVYNADAFNVAEGSMLDALIKQMPGTELTKQGEVFVNGRKVESLLLNGKDFFRGKNKLMLENLPYYTVKEIKVYDHTTEKAQALRDERADKEYVMDVSLKKKYSKGYMANVEMGAGTEDAYLLRLFGLRFTPMSRFAVVGGMNNLNMSDYSLSGYTVGDGTREGRMVSNLLTAELLTEHKHNKNVLTVELNRKKSRLASDEFQETYHNEGSTYSTSHHSQTNRNLGASLSNKYTLKLPIWLESNTQLRLNSQKDESGERYFESGKDMRQQGLAVLDSLFSMGVAVNDPSMISARRRWLSSKTKVYGVSQDFAFSQKLRSTDIIELRAGADYRRSEYDGDRFNSYLTWLPELAQMDVPEVTERPNTHVGASAEASYKVSRLLYNTDLKFFANYRFNRDKEHELITDVLTSEPDAMNSYNMKTHENIYSMGMNYNYDSKNKESELQTLVVVKLPLSVIDRNTRYSRHTLDTCLSQSPVFFEPSLTFTHRKRKGGNWRTTLWGITAQTSLKYSLPDATQLVTLPVTSDRINVYQGNLRLKSPAVWKSSLSWDLPMKEKSAYLQQSLNYTRHINRIVNTYRYEAGVYINRPDNINGTWNLEFTTRGQQFANLSKLKITINYNLKSNYLRLKNFVADGTTGKSLQIDNDELHNYAHLQLRSYYKSVSGGLRLSADWKKSLNERADIGYRDTWDYKADLWLSATLPAGIDWETECVLTKRQGYSNSELNKMTCDWNMGLSKAILKKKIVLSLKVIDLLRQYKSVAYVVNERGVRETRAVSLPSYFLFSMAYKFNKQPQKK